MMRALRYDRWGPADVLHIAEVAELSPRPGEVKVRVHAVGLNPLDWKIRAGHVRWVPAFRRPPRGVGTDFAGEIAGVGGGATARHVGERVFGSLLPFARDGALAEYVVVAAERLVPIPDNVSYEQAASLPVAGGTALQALADAARLSAGQRVLVTGAAGGVGVTVGVSITCSSGCGVRMLLVVGDNCDAGFNPDTTQSSAIHLVLPAASGAG
jgi:NADPH:quinone reductase-like Zn-dependent oxidoreductase